MRILGKNYYELLGITKDASLDEIKRAYKKRIIEFHPDKHGQDELALALTLDLQEILSTLTTPYKKQAYDSSLKASIEAFCVVCGKQLDADWKTYCSLHYKDYMNRRKNEYD